MYSKLALKLSMSNDSKQRSFTQFIAYGIGAMLGIAALGAPVTAEAARIYSTLPFAIYVCPISWTPSQIHFVNPEHRDRTNKAKYPDSNYYASYSDPYVKNTRRSGDGCIFLADGSKTRQRSESINWRDASQVNVRMAFSPSANNPVDDRCIFKMQSTKNMDPIQFGLTNLRADFQGGNYLMLSVRGRKVHGILRNAADQVMVEELGNNRDLECPAMLK